MDKVIISEICQKCAECCRHFPFVEVSQKDVDRLEEHTGLPYHEFTNPTEKDGKGYFLKFTENGDCIFLKEQGGNHSCGVYEARSEICKSWPSQPIQYDTCDKKMEALAKQNSDFREFIRNLT